MTDIGIAICGDEYAACVCVLPVGEDHTIHVCNCSGSWEYNEDGDSFRIHEWPNKLEIGLPLPSPWLPMKLKGEII